MNLPHYILFLFQYTPLTTFCFPSGTSAPPRPPSRGLIGEERPASAPNSASVDRRNEPSRGFLLLVIYCRPSVRVRLKVRMLIAEVLETLLYECVTWSPTKADYDRLRKAHHQMLLRHLGWRKRKREDHIVSYACLLYTSPSPRDQRGSRMPSSA